MIEYQQSVLVKPVGGRRDVATLSTGWSGRKGHLMPGKRRIPLFARRPLASRAAGS